MTGLTTSRLSLNQGTSRQQAKGRKKTAVEVPVLLPAPSPANKDSLYKGSALALLVALGVVAFTPARTMAQALPQGGTVAAGAATIGAAQGNALTVTQSSDRAVVNWNSFNVGQSHAVNFVQPSASAAALNRVTGGTGSTIAGTMNANGQVFLVNPNGIQITSTGLVNTRGFVASTLDITNDDFMAGRLKFTGNGSSADVINNGKIRARKGDVILIGGRVENNGTISARNGRVGLASGEQVAVDMEGRWLPHGLRSHKQCRPQQGPDLAGRENPHQWRARRDACSDLRRRRPHGCEPYRQH